jgi:hypothetical protein
MCTDGRVGVIDDATHFSFRINRFLPSKSVDMAGPTAEIHSTASGQCVSQVDRSVALISPSSVARS